MRRNYMAIVVALAVGPLATAVAQTGFSYQGRLYQNGGPADGAFSFEYSLFDAATGGNQIGTTFHAAGVVVTDGLFTSELDFGLSAFDGDPRWLEIRVRPVAGAWTPLTPRQPLTAAPYAVYALDGPGVGGGFWTLNGDDIRNNNSGDVGIGLPAQLTPGYPLEVMSIDATRAIYARDIANTGPSYGVYGETWSNAGVAVHGWATHATSGETSGVYGRADSPDGRGVYGLAWSSNGANAGVYGRSNSSNGRGVYGRADGAAAHGGYFEGRGYFSGNVGIGTTTPGAKLEIAGTPGVDGIKFPDGTLQTTAGGGPGGSVWSSNGNDIYYNAGDVGIGTTAPAFNLHARRQVPGGSGQPAATFGLQWSQQALPSNEDWLSFLVGGTESRPAGQEGTHIVRQAGKRMHFSVEDSINAGPLTPQLTISETGRLGVGTTSPAALLHVAGHALIEDATFQENVTFGDGAFFSDGGLIVNGPSPGGATDHSVSVYAQTGGATVRAWNDGAGKAGEFIIGSTSNALYAVEGKTAGTGVAVHGHTTGNGWAGYFVNRSATNSKAALYCRTDGTGLAFQADGVARMEVLEITGADLAEKFPVSEATEPGTVVEIDPDNPGKLRIARGAYNSRVAGVVSGAGDIPVGAILGNLPGHEDAPAIALSGRVWVACDATRHAIEVGDLLTTSASPGRAMAATDRQRAPGAIIGKAMTALAKGETGLVLVLVSLQ